MNHKKRFLILTSDSGFGHRSAARSVQKALEAIAPEQVDILIINPILETDMPKLWQQMETGYDSRVKIHRNYTALPMTSVIHPR